MKKKPMPRSKKRRALEVFKRILRAKKKLLDALSKGDHIAFEYCGELYVDSIESLNECEDGTKFLMIFLEGCKSRSEYVKKSDVLAIGSEDGDTKLNGWSGKYKIINRKRLKELDAIKKPIKNN